MRLRLYHHPDGTRIAYREQGVGPALCLLHSAFMCHREWEPIVEPLSDRFRVVLPDLPLHGDSEQDRRRPYTLEWFAGVLGGFAQDVLGQRPLLGGHGLGAETALEAVLAGAVQPRRLVLMPSRMHGPQPWPLRHALWRACAGAGLGPGTRVLARHAQLGSEAHRALSEYGSARAWARFARHHSGRPRAGLLDAYARIDIPVLLLWAGRDELHPLALADEALARIPNSQLRVLDDAGLMLAYDDPVGLARELAAFCG